MRKSAILIFRAACLTLLLALFSAHALGQNGKLEISTLNHLSQRASETVDINLDEHLLQVTGKFLSSKDADDAKLKEIINGLKGIYVRNYSFDQENEFTASDVEPIRAQLRSPGWSRFLEFHSRREGDNIEVYILLEGDKIGGLAILSVEPKELTVVNIVGTVDLDKLSDLEGQFGIPDLELERDTKSTTKKN